jgi:hypothetical protein
VAALTLLPLLRLLLLLLLRCARVAGARSAERGCAGARAYERPLYPEYGAGR